MKSEGYMANQLTTTLVQVTGLVLVIHSKGNTMNGTIQKKKDSLSDFQGLLFVLECVVVIITQKEIHTLQG